ncbi:MAG: hypothetical protein U0163_10255 [Gemmatimonadaceae bacterium]
MVVGDQFTSKDVAVERGGAVEIAVVKEDIRGANAEVPHRSEAGLRGKELVDAPRRVAEQSPETTRDILSCGAHVLTAPLKLSRVGLEGEILVQRVALVDQQDVLSAGHVCWKEIRHQQVRLSVELHMVARRDQRAAGSRPSISAGGSTSLRASRLTPAFTNSPNAPMAPNS